MFQRGGMLVRPAAWSVPASDERTTLAAGLRPIKVPALIDLLAQAATWTRYNRRRKKYLPDRSTHRRRRCPAEPERLLARARHHRDHHDTDNATRRLDPHRSGYRSCDTPLSLGDPDLHMPPIGTTRADAERALVRLVDLMTGFPFVTEVDRSVALSGLISPCVRGAVGMVPAHALTAPTAGTGKSHLVDVAAASSPAASVPSPPPGETRRKPKSASAACCCQASQSSPSTTSRISSAAICCARQ